MRIQPYLLGSGRAGQALLKSLSILEVTDPEFSFAAPIKLERNQSLKGLAKKEEFSLLLIANPHGLHAQKLIEAEGQFSLIVTEKPACTALDEMAALRAMKTPVAVCHGYRQSWGVQTLKQMISAGDLGDIFAIEGRYWQSSTAQRALEKNTAQSWKNDPKLSGPYDALLDIATHWADTALFLMPEKLQESRVWLSYANADAPHRDSHVHLNMLFAQGKRALCSISKTVHGSSNHFEVNVLGTKKSATWKFLEPDILEIGEGSTRTFISRKDSKWGSTQSAHHGLGWLEGYVEILRQALLKATGKEYEKYPDLADSVHVVETLLKASVEKN